VPSGFVPTQDKQYLVSFAQLPDGATLDRTERVIREMSDIALKEPASKARSLSRPIDQRLINSASQGIVFVTLKPFSERTTADLSGFAISQKLQRKFSAVKDAFIAIFPPPPVQGLGTIGASSCKWRIAASGYEALDQAMKPCRRRRAWRPNWRESSRATKISVPHFSPISTAPRRCRLGVERATFSTRCKSIWVRSMSTISTNSGDL